MKVGEYMSTKTFNSHTKYYEIITRRWSVIGKIELGYFWRAVYMDVSWGYGWPVLSFYVDEFHFSDWASAVIR